MSDSEIDDFKNIYKKYCKSYTYTPFSLQAVDKIVVFGDIHGDYKMAVKLLLMSGVAEIESEKSDPSSLISDEKNVDDDKLRKIYFNGKRILSSVEYKMKWIGGKTHVVQVGDQVDRCRIYGNLSCDLPETTLADENCDYKIMKLYADLHEQAIKKGGAVISLLGNHEIKNAMGSLVYVSVKGIQGFKNYTDPENPDVKFNDGFAGRKYAFAPGHEIGRFMGCTRTPAVVIGSNLFAHAGIVSDMLKDLSEEENKKETNKDLYGLNYDNAYLNKKIFRFKNREDFEHVNIVIKKWLLNLVEENDVDDLINITEPNKSMFWNRILGSFKPDIKHKKCFKHIDKVLKLFKINNIIVGHTPQSMQHGLNINGACDDHVWRVDTGSSAAFDRYDNVFMKTGNVLETRKFQYLVIENDVKFKLCYEDKCENLN
jgi:hypothetical protein